MRVLGEDSLLPDQTVVESFTGFVRDIEIRLKFALCAALGREAGMEATAEALAYGWENWTRIQSMENPAGYLYRVGLNKARRFRKRHPVLPPVPRQEMPWVEPALAEAMTSLSERQRVAVLLIHGFDWTLADVAGFLDVSVATVRQHLDRGMLKLQRRLGVAYDR